MSLTRSRCSRRRRGWSAEIGTGRFFLGQVETYGPLVARVGLQPAQQVQAWIAEQRQASEEGTFFGACNYAYIARRHPSQPTPVH